MTKLREYQSEVFFDCRNTLGEGLLWDVSSELLYWVDILEKQVFAWKQGAKSYQTWQLNNYPGCLAVCEDEQLLIAHEQGLSVFNPEGEGMKLMNAIESGKKDNRFNDGKCDPCGRFWAGSMRMDATGREGALYIVNRDFSVDMKIDGISISNGLAWSLSKNQMYYVDTGDNDIKIYHYDDETGDIRFDKVLVGCKQELGYFDGMTIDVDGNLWVAIWGGGCVLHIDSRTGETIGRVEVPTQHVSNCTFGGSDLDTLFITSASTGLSDEQQAEQPLAGSLFMALPGVQGTATPRFRVPSGLKKQEPPSHF